MALAEDYFFAAHDIQHGKLRLNVRAAGLGLAGSLFGDLILAGKINVVAGAITIAAEEPPEDDLGYRIFRQLSANQEDNSLRTWLVFVARGAIERVAVQLMRTGQVEAIKSRRPWGAKVRYLATNMQEASWPEDRLYGKVSRGEPMDFPDAMLAGLVTVTGLAKQVWWDGDVVTQRHVAAAVASLPMALREVLSHTEAAVGDLTLSPHK